MNHANNSNSNSNNSNNIIKASANSFDKVVIQNRRNRRSSGRSRSDGEKRMNDIDDRGSRQKPLARPTKLTEIPRSIRHRHYKQIYTTITRQRSRRSSSWHGSRNGGQNNADKNGHGRHSHNSSWHASSAIHREHANVASKQKKQKQSKPRKMAPKKGNNNGSSNKKMTSPSWQPRRVSFADECNGDDDNDNAISSSSRRSLLAAASTRRRASLSSLSSTSSKGLEQLQESMKSFFFLNNDSLDDNEMLRVSVTKNQAQATSHSPSSAATTKTIPKARSKSTTTCGNDNDNAIYSSANASGKCFIAQYNNSQYTKAPKRSSSSSKEYEHLRAAAIAPQTASTVFLKNDSLDDTEKLLPNKTQATSHTTITTTTPPAPPDKKLVVTALTKNQQAAAIIALKSASTYLPHLELGSISTHPQYDTIPPECTTEADIYALKTHEFVFVKRSTNNNKQRRKCRSSTTTTIASTFTSTSTLEDNDNANNNNDDDSKDVVLWTYAIIANRDSNSIRFVVDSAGSTKTLNRKHWNTNCIRLVNTNRQSSLMDLYEDRRQSVLLSSCDVEESTVVCDSHFRSNVAKHSSPSSLGCDNINININKKKGLMMKTCIIPTAKNGEKEQHVKFYRHQQEEVEGKESSISTSTLPSSALRQSIVSVDVLSLFD